MQTRQQSLDLRISFMLRRTYTDKDGKHPIILRISYRAEQRDTFTGFFIEDKYWLPRVGRVTAEEPNSSILNKKLQKLTQEASDHFDEFRYSRLEFSIDDLVEKIRGKNQPPDTLMGFVEEKIKEYKSRVDVDLSTPTWYKYQRVKNYLIEFLQTSRKMSNIPITRVDGQLLNQFYLYLRKDKKNANNSAVTLMNFLKTVLRQPVKRGLIKDDPFAELKLRFTPVDSGFLTRDDLNKITNCSLVTEAMQRNRDIFLLCCYTGLAYTDVKQLEAKHIIKDPDGSYYIKKSRQKTSIVSIIPLLPPAERILKKYSLTGDIRDFKIYIPCNQKLNLSLKKLGETAKVERELHMHLARHTFATTVTLSNKVPIESVSKMLGHSSLKHTMRYARVVGEKIKSDMEHVKALFQ
jgi:site-specific recombinase XerD